MFIRRGRPGSTQYLGLRVGLVCFSAGLWIAGVIIDDSRVTGAAIIFVLAALILGFAARRQDQPEPEAAEDIEG